MKLKRALSCLATTVGATVALMACSGGGSTATTTKVGNCTVPSSNVGSGAITGAIKGNITFQTTSLKDSFAQDFTPMISQFESLHPGVHVNWIDDPGSGDFTARQLTNANGCNMADVININPPTALALANAGFLMDFDKKAPGISQPFIPGVWETSTLPGHTGHEILPWYWAPLVQTFNTQLMQKAGLDPHNPPTTIMQQLDMADQIGKASGGQYYAFLANPINPNSARLPGDWQVMKVQIMNGDHSQFTFANDQKAVQWLTEMAKLYKDGAMPADSISQDTDPSQLYGQGKLVWGSPIPSFLRYVKQNAPSLYPVTGVAPGIWDARGYADFQGQYIGVPVTSKNPAAAIAFAKFLLDDQNQLAFDKDPKVVIFPSTTQALNDPFFTTVQGSDPFAQARAVAADEAKTSKVDTLWEWSDAVNNDVGKELQLAIQGQESPQTALQNAQNAANQDLAKTRKKA
jgi:multiple sugar transport system substrate-binding protein